MSLKFNKLQKESQLGVKAVLLASKLCQKVFTNLIQADTLTKQDASPVTVADYGSQAIINSMIHSEFPKDDIVAEEDAQELYTHKSLLDSILSLTSSVGMDFTPQKLVESIDLGNSMGGLKRFWTLDPIDGTKGFIRGDQYAICLALIENGQVEMGILACPNLPPHTCHTAEDERGSLFIAVKGEGAYQSPLSSLNFQRIQVSQVTSPSKSTFAESFEAGHSSHNDTERISHKLGISNKSLRMDSQAKYGLLARGDVDLYFRIPIPGKGYVENIWDHAAGCLIVQEAGGKVTDCNGKDLDFTLGSKLQNNNGVLASNGHLHSHLLENLK